VSRIERHEGLELLDGLVERRLAVVGLADEETRAGRVLRLRMPLHDLLEVRPRLRIILLAHVLLAGLVEVLGGKERLRLLPEHVLHVGAAGEQERQAEGARHRGATDKPSEASEKRS